MKTTLLMNDFILSRYLDISMKLTVDIGYSEKYLTHYILKLSSSIASNYEIIIKHENHGKQ